MVSPITADFDVIKLDTCVPAKIEFKNKSQPSNGLSYNWNFGNNNTSTTTDPSISYIYPGEYTVRLTASMQGCSISVSKNVKVYSIPDISFIADTSVFCRAPFTVKFKVTGDIQDNYSWDFGDGQHSNDREPQHTFTNYGIYDIKLTVKNEAGCSRIFERLGYIYSEKTVIQTDVSPVDGCCPLQVDYQVFDSNALKLDTWQILSGHGKNSNQKEGTFIYDTTGGFTIKFIGTNVRGCKAEANRIIHVGTPPQADFDEVHYEGCNDSMIHFINLTNTHKPKADQFKWDFGDGETSSEENPVHRFRDTGTMNIQLIAYYNGCPDTFTRMKLIKIKAVVAILADTFICYPSSINSLNKSKGGHLWEWYLNGIYYSRLKNPLFSLKPGLHTIILKAKDTLTGCEDADTTVLNVIPPPLDKIIVDILNTCVPATIKLSDTSTQKLTYYWEIPGADQSYVKSPQMTINDGGTYSVILRVIEEHGCSATFMEKDIIVLSDMNVSFIQSEHAGCIPLKVNVSDISTSNIPIKIRKWDFDQGNVLYSWGKDTTFTYNNMTAHKNQNTGYYIRLTLTDEKGCTETISNKIYPTKPKPYINELIKDNCKEVEIDLNTLVNDTTAYLPCKIAWYINNVLISSNPNVKLKFDKDTILNICLTFTDAFECISTNCKQIIISLSPPKADFTYMISSSVNNCPPTLVHFYNKSKKGKYDIVKYIWDFGNNTFSNVNSPVSTYSYPGIYSVSLIAEDAIGCRDTIKMQDIVSVNGATGSFDFQPKKGCGSVETVFTLSAQNAKSFLWDFGDGNVSEDSCPVHHYTYGGIFRPLLLMKDTSGCLTSLVKPDSVTVFNNPHAQFSLKNIMTCLDKEVHFINNTWHEQEIKEWEWDLGNGFKTSAFEPKYKYNDTGRYSVSLKVTDVEDCIDSIHLPNIVIVYFDAVNNGIPFIYRTTHLPESPLTEITFSSVHDLDFSHYVLYRTDTNASVRSFRELSNKYYDTLQTDTFYAASIPQCYLLQTYDFCDNPSATDNLHCLIQLNASSGEDGNHLEWTHYRGWKEIEKYSIYRYRPLKMSNFVKIDEVQGNQNNYLDTNVNCSEVYYYNIVAHQKDEAMQLSSSNVDSAIAGKTMHIDPVKLIRVSVEDEHVLVDWETKPRDYEFKYNIFRHTEKDGKKLIYIADSTESYFIDKEVNTARQSYIYNIQVFHPSCLFYSEMSNAGKSILLKLNKTEAIYENMLVWNSYYHWDEGVSHYKLFNIDVKTGNFKKIAEIYHDSVVSVLEEDTLNINHNYRITAISKKDSTIISNSNIVRDINIPRISIPNAFTPNDDYLNDFFEAECYGCILTKMQIFNRWGELIFESTKSDAKWDGLFKGQKCPLGVYYYHILANSEYGIVRHYGTVTLLR